MLNILLYTDTNLAPWTNMPTCNDWTFFIITQNTSNRLIFYYTMCIVQKVKVITWYTHDASWLNTPSARRCTWTIIRMIPVTFTLLLVDSLTDLFKKNMKQKIIILLYCFILNHMIPFCWHQQKSRFTVLQITIANCNCKWLFSILL